MNLVAAAIGVLTGLEQLMGSRPRAHTRPTRIARTQPRVIVKTRVRRDYFRISRTKSEVGYVYWVLQGFGAYKCFVLLDTWQQALDEANARVLAGASESVEAELVFTSAG
jgi:hypothetical protein